MNSEQPRQTAKKLTAEEKTEEIETLLPTTKGGRIYCNVHLEDPRKVEAIFAAENFTIATTERCWVVRKITHIPSKYRTICCNINGFKSLKINNIPSKELMDLQQVDTDDLENNLEFFFMF